MTFKWILKWMVIFGIGLPIAWANAEENLALKTDREKVSYGIGVEMARNLNKQGIVFDVNWVIKGLTDGLLGKKILLPEEDLRKIMALYMAEHRQKQREARKTILGDTKNQKEGEAFLTENKQKEAVVTLSSGLQYKILKEGNGKKPTETDTVEVHYRGTLIDGTEFESSYQTGHPTTFAVAAVIRGWKEALSLMPVGSNWQLLIPPQLAYGARGSGRTIPPNATLIFELELLAIK
jgi:FKBP-type peptidyl-prolyl cis-trans isomerase